MTEPIPCHSGQYILDSEGNAVAATDLLAWAKFYEKDANRIVEQTYLDSDRVWVSTVFTALRKLGDFADEPLLWQTYVTGLEEVYVEDYASLEAAKEGHQRAIAFAEAQIAQRETKQEASGGDQTP